jgi:hypothetical protein
MTTSPLPSFYPARATVEYHPTGTTPLSSLETCYLKLAQKTEELFQSRYAPSSQDIGYMDKMYLSVGACNTTWRLLNTTRQQEFLDLTPKDRKEMIEAVEKQITHIQSLQQEASADHKTIRNTMNFIVNGTQSIFKDPSYKTSFLTSQATLKEWQDHTQAITTELNHFGNETITMGRTLISSLQKRDRSKEISFIYAVSGSQATPALNTVENKPASPLVNLLSTAKIVSRGTDEAWNIHENVNDQVVGIIEAGYKDQDNYMRAVDRQVTLCKAEWGELVKQNNFAAVRKAVLADNSTRDVVIQHIGEQFEQIQSAQIEADANVQVINHTMQFMRAGIAIFKQDADKAGQLKEALTNLIIALEQTETVSNSLREHGKQAILNGGYLIRDINQIGKLSRHGAFFENIMDFSAAPK